MWEWISEIQYVWGVIRSWFHHGVCLRWTHHTVCVQFSILKLPSEGGWCETWMMNLAMIWRKWPLHLSDWSVVIAVLLCLSNSCFSGGCGIFAQFSFPWHQTRVCLKVLTFPCVFPWRTRKSEDGRGSRLGAGQSHGVTRAGVRGEGRIRGGVEGVEQMWWFESRKQTWREWSLKRMEGFFFADIVISSWTEKVRCLILFLIFIDGPLSKLSPGKTTSESSSHLYCFSDYFLPFPLSCMRL